MDIKDILLASALKNGYAKIGNNKEWDIAERKNLYLNEKLSEGFLNLRASEIYKKAVLDRELTLLKDNAKKIAESLGDESFNLIDLYCGDGKKACEFIKALGSNAKIRYCPMNVSKHLVDLAIENVKKCEFKNVVEFCPRTVRGEKHAMDILENDLGCDGGFDRKVVLVLGSVLASYQINDALFALSGKMRKGDIAIFGNGLKNEKSLANVDVYKGDIWNKWFNNLVESIGFSDVSYDARFENSRVDMFYKINEDKSFDFDGNKIDFKKGDSIIVAKLYKYSKDDFDRFCKMYFKDAELIEDPDGEYALVICKR